MSGDSLVAQNRSRIFDGSADVKVFRLPIVGRNKIKSGRILIINPGRIHETTGTGWLECFRQLPDLKGSEIVRQLDELVRFQKIDHLLFPALVSLQKCFLIPGNVFAA